MRACAQAAAVVLVAGAACGRFQFDPHARDAAAIVTDARRAFDAPVALDAAPATITWAGPFAERHQGVLQTDSFSAQAIAGGDAVVLLVACAAGAPPASVAVTAPGWSFSPISVITGANNLYAQTFGAIAPDTVATTVTVMWSLVCDGGTGEFGDELAMADASGGAVTFDAHVETTGVGDCTAPITTVDAADAVWAGCFTQTALVSPGAGFTKTADDGGGDWAELEVTASPAGTPVAILFHDDPTSNYVLGGVTIKPQ